MRLLMPVVASVVLAVPCVADGPLLVVTTQTGTAEAAINGVPLVETLGPLPGDTAIATQQSGNEYAYARVVTDYPPNMINAEVYVERGPLATDSEGTSDLTIEFTLYDWADLVWHDVDADDGDPRYFSAKIELWRGTDRLWIVPTVSAPAGVCQQPSPYFPECHLLEPGDYRLVFRAHTASHCCNGYSTAYLDMEFVLCPDPDGDGLCNTIDNCPTS